LDPTENDVTFTPEIGEAENFAVVVHACWCLLRIKIVKVRLLVLAREVSNCGAKSAQNFTAFLAKFYFSSW